MNNDDKTNPKEADTTSKPKISLVDIMYMVENGINPPGIQVYEDMPSEEKIEATKSIITKKNKPWLESIEKETVWEIKPDEKVEEIKEENKDNINEN